MNRRRRKTAKSRRITERNTGHGYWWRFIPSEKEPGTKLIPVLRTAAARAAEESRESGKTTIVASAVKPAPTIYVFASDHPDARKPGISIWYELTPTGRLLPPA
jgi:hypothetical protein